MITCTKYTPINKGYLLAFVNIQVEKWDLIIYGLSLMSKDGKKWVNFPSTPYEKDGEKKYAPIFSFTKKENYFKFKEEILKAIDKYAVESQTSSETEESPNSEHNPVFEEVPF